MPLRFCRMTNYELLRWLVETRSYDIHHYRMQNRVAVDGSTIKNVELSRDCKIELRR